MRVMLTFAVLLGSACVPRPPAVGACSTADDCEAGLRCESGQCVQCVSDADCSLPERCGAVTAGRCGCRDVDGDGHACDDCRDDDPTNFPGATEVCDGKDNDCDAEADEGVIARYYADQDRDGVGNSDLFVDGCAAPLGYVTTSGDCNDVDATSAPTRTEVCDNRDNDCDGLVDEGTQTAFLRDGDGDGYGDSNNVVLACQLPASGFTQVPGDCDDTRADVHPDSLETCNSRDDDCDGTVDGQTRACDNACGAGSETCVTGLWKACTAPAIVTINTTSTLTGARADFDCLVVGSTGRVVVNAGLHLHTRGWLRVEGGGSLELGPDAMVSAASDISFIDQSKLLATRANLVAGRELRIGQDARFFLQAPQAPAYAGGGSPACASSTAAGLGGAGGGSRGGSGGQGGTCGPLSTQPRLGAGGLTATNGANGCACPCSETASGGATTGGAGGAPLSGGGGGANGGSGGLGGSGAYSGVTYDGGVGGLAVAQGLLDEGGGGGGSAGKVQVTLPAEACQGGGGAGAGVLSVTAASFLNQGTIFADGAPGESSGGFYTNSGGGGAGAGGTLVFAVDTFDNRGAVSAVGGRGGSAWCNLVGARAGGGGGGGGGRVWVTSVDGGSSTVGRRGNIFVGGGVGGAGFAADPGATGGDGWVVIR